MVLIHVIGGADNQVSERKDKIYFGFSERMKIACEPVRRSTFPVRGEFYKNQC